MDAGKTLEGLQPFGEFEKCDQIRVDAAAGGKTEGVAPTLPDYGELHGPGSCLGKTILILLGQWIRSGKIVGQEINEEALGKS